MSKSADMRACAAKLQHERLASAAKFLEFYAAKFCARMGKIYNAFLRGKICGALLAGRFGAARRSKIRSVKYYAEFYSAAHGDKIDGAMADKKGFGAVLAGAGNFVLQNACVNLRPRNTYVDLKFKGSANSKPSGGVNFKFKNDASFRFLCGGNAKPIKSNGSADALNSSDANKILASIWTGRILSSSTSAMDLVFDAAANNFISSGAARILSSSAEAGILASILANEILNLSAAGEILKLNAVNKILSLGAASLTGVDFGPKGAGGC
ncbi:hypothetical protein [uncultured Campylobacter sp.]|uniref:hypothetical protein n=1 Tax=uncultured Campylobacter sp. TaxID=218934 RepID=UPI002611D560|nr:hypothetical protein [uncultured Campylobacter sp.]